MKKIIQLTPKSTKWVYVINGIINLTFGIREFTSADTLLSWGGFASIFFLIAGLIMMSLAYIVFNRNHKLCPKIEIDNNSISIREDLHKPRRKISWTQVKEIIYKPLALDFLMKDDITQEFKLTTNSEISLEIKKAIREFANRKEINVVSG